MSEQKLKIEPRTIPSISLVLSHKGFKGLLLIGYLLLESFYLRCGKYVRGCPTTLIKCVQFIFLLAQKIWLQSLEKLLYFIF